jgi:hypothetical protein
MPVATMANSLLPSHPYKNSGVPVLVMDSGSRLILKLKELHAGVQDKVSTPSGRGETVTDLNMHLAAAFLSKVGTCREDASCQ